MCNNVDEIQNFRHIFQVQRQLAAIIPINLSSSALIICPHTGRGQKKPKLPPSWAVSYGELRQFRDQNRDQRMQLH